MLCQSKKRLVETGKRAGLWTRGRVPIFPTTPAADDPDDRATGGQSIQPKT